MKRTLDLHGHSGAAALAVTNRLASYGEVDSERGVSRSALLCDPRRCIHLDHSMFRPVNCGILDGSIATGLRESRGPCSDGVSPRPALVGPFQPFPRPPGSSHPPQAGGKAGNPMWQNRAASADGLERCVSLRVRRA